jgi:hypothetical protein
LQPSRACASSLDWDDRRMAIAIVFETQSMTVNNERGIATGWEPGRLSDHGLEQALQLDERRKADGLTAPA